MAGLLTNMAQVNGETLRVKEGIEYNIPDYYSIRSRYGVREAYSNGILCGVDKSGTFNPQGTLTRAEPDYSTAFKAIVQLSYRLIVFCI
ncbi:S-layer homology domain-containing protein [Clostridium aminobutyricum]|uniref:S-layer homology domain-containing protein n=1 Tax=Clostridium aminobutyricum TaxID=33953 RepID=A0A939DAJ3_CLOAM|nr:S-layer homology domain-containing protein [Clostridium aminobutyricum]MBN7774150.1 S-layer homology domain-containing protein [Clostridium aminobutyricum]